MKKTIVSILSLLIVSACSQATPSMMNSDPVELVNETIVEQVALGDLSDSMLTSLANHYSKNGVGPLELTVAFDPTSKTFTAMRAVKKLEGIKNIMATKGVKNVETDTLPIKGAEPALMISFDSVRAEAPSSCQMMPGLNRDGTTRYIGEYKFGCSVETMLAKQIVRPADLQGNEGLGQRSGRREANVLQGYEGGVPREPLEGLSRDNLGAE